MEKRIKSEREGPPHFFEQGQVMLIDKPLNWTSFDVIRKLRRLVRTRKIGHAGTLDPLATGLLILCTGKYTKRINDYMAQEKEYTGTITLGAVTPTYDLESERQQLKDYSSVTRDLLQTTIKEFTGPILQVPPAHSAIKVGGKRVYELARKGQEVKLDPRPVTIKEFVIMEFQLPVIGFRVVCSTGTYIRSLANDLGAALGCGGYLSSLRRTRIGEFTVQAAMTIADAEEYIERKFAEEGGETKRATAAGEMKSEEVGEQREGAGETQREETGGVGETGSEETGDHQNG